MSNRTASVPRSADEIARSIEADLRSGARQPGDRLDPVRRAAERLGVAPGTVAAAYQELARRGTVVGQGRAGTFIAARPPVGAHGQVALPAGVVDLRSGNPDASFLPEMPRPPGDPVRYGTASVLPELAVAGRRWLEANGVDATHLAVVHGAMDGVERVLQAHLRPGDAIAVEDPGYPNVVDLARALGLAPVAVSLDGAGMEVAALAAVLRQVRAVVLTPRAQNPTGAAFTEARARLLREVLDRRPEVLVVEDDHNGDVAGVPLRSVAVGRERWAVVHSMAKTLGPDWRLALVAGDTATVDRVHSRLRLGSGWVSYELQRPVAAALADRRVRAQVRRAATAYGERRRALVEALRRRGIRAHGTSGFNVWVPVTDEAVVVAGLLSAGWGVQGGTRFRHHAPPGVRVSVSLLDPVDVERFAGAFADVVAGGEAGA